MRHWVLAALLLVAGLPVGGQAPQPDVVAAIQRTLVQDLDPSLPPTALATWLRSLSGPEATIGWELNDCGEQTGVPDLDRERNFPMCVEATLRLLEDRTLSISFAAGTFNTAVGGRAGFYLGSVREHDGPPRFLKSLAPVPVIVPVLMRRGGVFEPNARRADIERLLGHPAVDGGITAIGHTRYFIEPGVLVDVPYDDTDGPERPANRATGVVTVRIGARSFD